MKFKKTLSLLLSIIMILSFIQLAYAQNNNTYSFSNQKRNIKCLVENYFNLQMESLKKGEFCDFKHLFDIKNPIANKTYEYESGRLNYVLVGKKHHNETLNRYSIKFDYKEIKYEGNMIYVDVLVKKKLFYDITKGIPDIDNTMHTIKIINKNNELLIIDDVYKDEFKDTYGINTDFKQLIKSIDNEDKIARFSIVSQQPLEEDIIINSIPGDYYISYDRSRAISYALSHTSNNNDDTNYNSNFAHFEWDDTFMAGDCQNFVSQCLWYGYGGKDNKDDINSHKLPMFEPDWWCDSKTASSVNGKWYWTKVSHFYSWIKNNEYGPRGYDKSYTSAREGDIVFKSDLSHVYIITDIIDHDSDGNVDWNEIYVSAHTKNRLNNRLSSLYSSPTSKLKFMGIKSFKWNDGN